MLEPVRLRAERLSDPEGREPRPARLSAEAATDVETVARGGATQIVGQISQRGFAFFFNSVAARTLDIAGFGLYRVVAQTLTFLGQLGLLGFNYAAMRFITRARATGDRGAVRGTARIALWSVAIASGTIVVLGFFGAEWLAGPFGKGRAQDERFAELIRIGILYVPFFAFMQVLRYCTQAYKTMVPSVIVGNIIQPTARFGIGAVLLLAGFGVSAAIATDAISMGIGAVAGVYYYRRVLTKEERAAKPKAKAGPIIRFALPQSGASLLGIQALGLGVILLGLRGTNTEAGLFAVALALQGPASVFLSGMVNIWAPVVSDLYDQGALARLDSLYKTITRWITTLALPISAAMIIEPDLFAYLFGGPKAVPAATVIAILAVGNIFYTCTGPTGYVLSMTGRPGVNFLNSLLGVALYAVLGWFVIPEHGAIGLAWVDAGVTGFVNLLRVAEAKILVGVQPFGRSFLKPIAGTIAGSLVALGCKGVFPDTLPAEIAGVTVGGAVYVLAMKLMGLDEEELYVWRRIKKRAFRRRSGE